MAKASPPGTTRTAAPEARRLQLIEATITVISKRGISGTTLSLVTKEADLSLGLANFHFNSKDALLVATLQHLAEEHRKLWISKIKLPSLDPATKLQAIVDAQFHPTICNRRKLSVWFAFFGETRHRKSYRQTSENVDMERQRVTADICSDIIRERGYGDLSAVDISQTLEGLFDGLWLNILMYPGVFNREAARAQVSSYIALCFPKDFS